MKDDPEELLKMILIGLIFVFLFFGMAYVFIEALYERIL